MAGNRMESLMPVVFGLTAVGAVVAFSAITPADAKAYQERFSAYLNAARDARPLEVLALPAVAPLPESEQVAVGDPTPLAQALALSTLRPHLDTYVPGPAPGWTLRATVDDDYPTLTGVAPIVWSAVDPAIARIEAEMATHLSAQRDMPNRSRGFEQVHVTYESGDAMVMLSVRHLPARVFDGPEGAAFSMLQELMRGLCTTAFAAEEFVVINGLPFEISDVEGSQGARRINAYMGHQMDIEVLTNARDEDVMTVLSQLDVMRLNDMLDDPLLSIGSQAVTVLADAR